MSWFYFALDVGLHHVDFFQIWARILTWVIVLMLWSLGSDVYVLARMGDVAPLSKRIGHAHAMLLVFLVRSLLWAMCGLTAVNAGARPAQDAHQRAPTSSIGFDLRQSNFLRAIDDLNVNFGLHYFGWLESSWFESATLHQLLVLRCSFLSNTMFAVHLILLSYKLGLWAVQLLLKVANIFI